MSYFVDTIYFVITMPEISSPLHFMSNNPDKHLVEIKDGLRALEKVKIPLSEVGFDAKTLHDLEKAIDNDTLPAFVKFMEGKGELTEVLQTMRSVRDLMTSMPQ